MIIKSGTLLLFDPDALKIEYKVGMENKYYIMAYKNGKQYYVEGFSQEKAAKLKLSLITEKIKKSSETIEI